MLEARFIPGQRGALFVLLHGVEHPRSLVLFAPPLAEEMNKARRMVALQARALAERGHAVLVPDLFGCGESAGDFAEADWAGWRADLAACARWLRGRFAAPLVLWGLRAGCLLIAEALAEGELEAERLLYWQPVLEGESQLRHLLRLRASAALLGGRREPLGELRARLDAGETLEVAGYALSPALAAGLAAARLAPPAFPLGWFELALDEPARLAPAALALIERWRGEGARIEAHALAGEPFWSTQEIGEAPALIAATLAWFEETVS